jgi:hypothetical protein
MKGFLQSALSILALVAVVSAVGLTIEWYRRRALRTWAAEQGGTFEAGAFLAGVAVPEAAAFGGACGGEGDGKTTYHNVSRFTRPEASYVVAQSHSTWKDMKGNVESSSQVVCFVTLPGGPLPEVSITPAPHAVARMGAALVGRPEPATLKVPDATSDFEGKFRVLPRAGMSEVPPTASLARLLPPSIQQELLARENLIAGLEARGTVVRLRGIGTLTGYPHQEILAAALRLGALWTGATSDQGGHGPAPEK